MRRIPIGIEDFEEMRRGDYYFIDKTSLIEQVLTKTGKVKLFTRPRRFGKTLNMSMLQHFFEVGADAELFGGLYISENKDLYENYMGKYPVVSVSLKGVEGATFKEARRKLIDVINREARRYRYIRESSKLDSIYQGLFEVLLSENMDVAVLDSSLQRLTEILELYFDQKVIVLIDEYDVPLAKAYQNGYYDDMVCLLRGLFGNVLKTNLSLEFAVLTGCLRIAKESIFTGLNNFKVYSILDAGFDETFGFTDDEVKAMLSYYHQEKQYDIVREWYDGYRFGRTNIYCPWDVMNYCSDYMDDPDTFPKNYWMNTSGNDVIEHFIDGVNEPHKLTKRELERLVNGETVVKRVNEMLTYKDLYSTIDNLWSTLLMTGYLTQRGRESDGRYHLAIPNREIRSIVTDHILAMFRKEVMRDGKMAEQFCGALVSGKAEAAEEILTAYLGKTISIRDTFVRKNIRENFYHGILLGILSYKSDWDVLSNQESGLGYSDILITTDSEIGIVIEVKYSDNDLMLERECKEALKQIEEKDYCRSLAEEGVEKILRYGVAFYVKKCRIIQG